MRRVLSVLLIAVVILPKLTLAFDLDGDQPEEARRLEYAGNLNEVEKNLFRTDRGLQLYGQNFGEEFRKKISSLGPNDVWVDLGCGDAVALKEYLTAKSVPGFTLPPVDQRAKVVGIAYLKPENRPKLDKKLLEVLKHRGQGVYQTIIGNFTEIPRSVIPKGTVVTSEMGVISYVEDYTYAMQKAFDITQEGGVLIYRTGFENTSFAGSPEMKIEEPSFRETPIPTARNLKDIPGTKPFIVTEGLIDEYTEARSVRTGFQKTSKEVDFPNFEVKRFEAAYSDGNPYRILSRKTESRKKELEAKFSKEEEMYNKGQTRVEINFGIDPAPPSCARRLANSLKTLLGVRGR